MAQAREYSVVSKNMIEYIYILINTSVPGLVKIGRTNRTPTERATELSRATGVPTPFIIAYEETVSDSAAAEKAIHALLSEQGVRPNSSREFFEVSLSNAVTVVNTICLAFKPSSKADANVFSSDPGLKSVNHSDAAINYYFEAIDHLYGGDEVFQDAYKAKALFELSLNLGY